MKEPEVNVGIMCSTSIRFCLNTTYQAKGTDCSGEQKVELIDGGILWNGSQYSELQFSPKDSSEASFSLHEVTIGVSFHWERQETQTFSHALKFIVDEGKIHAVNILPVEKYLESVISSEMKATSSLEFLKAHAVISRSWLIAQMKKRTLMQKKDTGFFSIVRTKEEYIRWYDREDHTIFDVCADDHCQRYQGITRTSSPSVSKAIEATRGELLIDGNRICDARFSKCCGGVSEEFEACWEDKHYKYLEPVACSEDGKTFPDLTIEKNAEKWISTTPKAFCNTHDAYILKQILNNYDQETTDFYRWTVTYTQEELKELICRKSKTEFGNIIDLIPMERGKSGRIIKLKIVGSEHTVTIGKELEIRRTLSETHLFSSAFTVECSNIENGIPQTITLHGAGWGHGVGLCQIGAAVMGEKGYTYDKILLHYYKNAEIKKLY